MGVFFFAVGSLSSKTRWRLRHHPICPTRTHFSGLRSLLMVEEMLDLLHDDFRADHCLHRSCDNKGNVGVNRDAKQLLIAAMLVFEIEHGNRPAAQHTQPGNEWRNAPRPPAHRAGSPSGDKVVRNESRNWLGCGIGVCRIRSEQQRAGCLVKFHI